MEQWTGLKLGEKYIKAEYCHPAYSTYIMWNAELDDYKVGIKIQRRNTNNLSYANDTTLMAESEERLKSLFVKGERREWKNWLKTQHSRN